MKTKVLSKMAALLTTALVYLQNVISRSPFDEGILDWITTIPGQRAIERAVQKLWWSITKEYQEDCADPGRSLVVEGYTPVRLKNQRFSVAESFKLKSDGGPYSLLSEEFLRRFGTRTEDYKHPYAGMCLYLSLTRDASDNLIFVESLPICKKRGEVGLAMIHGLVEMGEILLKDGRANIFYVKDDEGCCTVVVLYWSNDGWSVEVYPFDSEDRGGTGGFVFFCDQTWS